MDEENFFVFFVASWFNIFPPVSCRKLGQLLFIAFQIVWLNVIVPGHTRGAIPIPGADCEARGVKACCQETKHRPVSPKPHGCAICYFAATLSTPPAIVCAPPPLLPSALVEVHRARSLIARRVVLPFYICGPPTPFERVL